MSDNNLGTRRCSGRNIYDLFKPGKDQVVPVILFALGFSATVIHLSFLTRSFFSFPVMETSNTVENVPIEFPSVTLCNINPISVQKLSKTFKYNTDMVTIFQFLYDAAVDSKDQFSAFHENLPNISKDIGHSFDNFIINCRYDNAECVQANFSTFFDSENYYNCYTFNDGFDKESEKLKNKLLHVSRPGIHHGLSLMLSLENEDGRSRAYGLYDKDELLKVGAGVRVQIHAPGTMPNPSLYGFDVSPGFSTNIALKAKKLMRPSQPYGNCTRKFLNIDRQYRNTISTCLQQCRQKLLIEACGCKHSSLLMQYENHTFHGTSIDFCSKCDFRRWGSLSTKERNQFHDRMNCKDNFLSRMDGTVNEARCGCYKPCEETEYYKFISASYWPMDFYHLSFLQDIFKNMNSSSFVSETLTKLEQIYSISPNVNMTLNQTERLDVLLASSFIRQSFVRLNVYIDDISIEETRKVPAYGIADLMADVGGTLGLWLGISFLTLIKLLRFRKGINKCLHNDIEISVSELNHEHNENTPEL